MFLFLGEKSSVFIVFCGILVALMSIFSFMDYFQLNMWKICIFLIALLFSVILNFGIYFCIGILGLWLSEISRVFPAIGIILSVMSGSVFPLDILGESVNRILLFLPFKYLLQFPVDIITGKQLEYSLLFPLAIQFSW